MTSEYEVVDDTTGQTQSYTTETGTHSTEAETHTTEIETGTTEDSESHQRQHEEEEEAHGEEALEDVAVSEEDHIDDGSQTEVPSSHVVLFESFAGKSVALKDHLPLATSLSREHYLAKYWSQRFRLFSLYDNDIRVDHGKEECTIALL